MDSTLDWLDGYNVVWNSPSDSSAGSMPAGNGDIGINLWADKTGALSLYISKGDAWSGDCRLLKLIKVVMTVNEAEGQVLASFQQELLLKDGMIRVTEAFGDLQVRGEIFADANAPQIRLRIKTNSPARVSLALESWRTEDRRVEKPKKVRAGLFAKLLTLIFKRMMRTNPDKLSNTAHKMVNSDIREHLGFFGQINGPYELIVKKDMMFTEEGALGWYHRNTESIWEGTLKLQGLSEITERTMDPLMNGTFGGMATGANMRLSDDQHLVSSEKAYVHDLVLTLHSAQTENIDEWKRQLFDIVSQTRDYDAAFDTHCNWWHEFWERSSIRVTGAGTGFSVTQGYQLQRFIHACAGRSRYPTRFNGTLFTVDHSDGKTVLDPDFRRWGGAYWFQNTRLMYWPLIASGDYEMMLPFFDMYLKSLPVACLRTSRYFDHRGACFPETMYFWGTYTNDDYGWNRKDKPLQHVDNTYIRHYWSGALELLAMAVEYYRYTQDKVFGRTVLKPLATEIILFYREHYSTGSDGKILIKPAQSLEIYADAVDPLPEIAGLHYILPMLIRIGEDVFCSDDLTGFASLLEKVPDIPKTDIEGKEFLMPAHEYANPHNFENPELYAVFPYRLYVLSKGGSGKDGEDIVETGIRTYMNRRFKTVMHDHMGWEQDDIQAALLGLTDEAKVLIERRYLLKDPQSRFPAFWQRNFNWVPDQDHGCAANYALQTMIMQTDRDRIMLFPAWPKEWDLDFSLHAPMNTTVKGVLKSGVLNELYVYPQTRIKDVEISGGIEWQHYEQ